MSSLWRLVRSSRGAGFMSWTQGGQVYVVTAAGSRPRGRVYVIVMATVGIIRREQGALQETYYYTTRCAFD